MTEAVFTLATASGFLTSLGVKENFDVDVKILLNVDVDSTNVKTV